MFETYKIINLEKEADANLKFLFDDIRKRNFKDWEQRLEKMRLDYIALKEKFKHDKKQLLKLAIDWKDYTNNFYDLNTHVEIKIEAMGDEVYDKLIEETEVVLREIEKRFSKLVNE